MTDTCGYGVIASRTELMRSFGSRLHLLSLIAALAAIDCSGSDGSTSGDNDAGFESMDSGVTCPSPTITTAADPACAANYTAIVRGQAQDQEGQPNDAVLAQMCIDEGLDNPKCLRPIATCSPGYFEIPLEEIDRCLVSAVVHMIPEQEGDFASTFCALDLGNPAAVDFTVAMPFVSYALDAPSQRPPLGDEAMERTVIFPGGIEVDVTPNRYVVANGYEALGGRFLGSEDPLPCGAESQNFDGIVAFGPSGNIQDPGNPVSAGFPLRIPAGGLAQGTTVDLFVQGSLDCQLEDGTRVTEGEWLPSGTATVDANGMISGGRLPCFNWLAWRAQ